MTPLKIHDGSYALIEYLTCWKYAIFHTVLRLLVFIRNREIGTTNKIYAHLSRPLGYRH